MRKDKDADKGGITRRGFLKAAGIAGAGTVAAGGLAFSTALAAGGAGGETPRAQVLPRRKLGKTGVDVSALALGGMFDTINNQLLLKQAFDWGVRYWDTAEGYGEGKSEEGIGRWLNRNPDKRKDIFLVTKSHPEDPSQFPERLDKALKRLQTDYVDLYFFHGISGVDGLNDKVKEWAARAKKEGKIKFFGFSTHANMEDCLLGASKLDWIDVVMHTYNFRVMQTEKMKEAIASCVKAGIGLVAMKTMGAGVANAESEAELKLVGRFLEKGFTDQQAKLKAVWEDPNIASICSQMPNLTILAANVAAARDQTKLSRIDFDLFAAYAGETRQGYCAGCTGICSSAVGGAVPIGEIMRYLMYYHAYGDRDLARAHYAALPGQAREMLSKVDYGPAERSCPQGLAIARLMHSAAALLA